MDALLPHSTQRGGEIGPGAQTLSTRDHHQITALPTRAFRDSNSTVIASQARAYGRVFSHNPHASTSSNISNDPFSHRRRGSTLKVVMRKLFGKRRSSHVEEEEDIEGPSGVSHQALHSIRISNRIVPETKQPSEPSIGPATPNPIKSLAVSHPSSVSSDHVALTSQDKRIEIPSQIVRRRATLPSLILTEDDDTKKSIFSAISPTSTRPASAINEVDEANVDSKSQPSIRAHRRSRSADALQELVRRHRMSPIQWRRRSDEIKFWRTSVFENDEDDDGEEQPQHSSPDVPTTTATDSRAPDDLNDGIDTPHSETAAAPFPLESLIASMADPDATVEQRLTTLEVKLMDLEFAISKIQGTDNSVFPKPAENPTEKSKIYEDSPNNLSPIASETSSQSSLSFGGAGRPISTSTVRQSMVYSQPAPWQGSSWSSMNLHGISIEQYSALVTLVRREQTARKALESQVTQLQEEMQQIRRTSGMPVSPPGTLYPIPSPDSDHVRFQRRQRPSSSRKDSNTSADTKLSEPRSRDSPNKYRLTRDTDSRNGSNMI